MDAHNDRYLFHLEFFDVDSRALSQQHLPVVRTAATFFEAVTFLINPISLDAFDPHTAANRGLTHYIQEATVMDMSNGDMLLRTMRIESDEPAFKHVGTYLAIEPGGGHTHMQEIMQKFGTAPSQETQLFPFLLKAGEGDDQFLYPGSFLHTLSYHAFNATINLQDANYPLKISTAFEGHQLRDPMVREDGLQYPTLRSTHYFSTEKEALTALVLMPHRYFDKQEALQQGLDAVYHKGGVFDIPTDTLLAATHVYDKQGKATGKEMLLEGRYVRSKYGKDYVIAGLGLPKELKFLTLSGQDLLKLAYFSAEDRKLVSTPLMEQITDRLGHELDAFSQAHAYTGFVRLQLRPEARAAGHAARPFDVREIYSHCHQLTEAIQQVIQDSLHLFSPSTGGSLAELYEVTDIRLTDNKDGLPLLRIHVREEGPDKNPTALMTLDARLINAPELKRFDPLAPIVFTTHGQQEGQQYTLPVGEMVDQHLQPSPFYNRFYLTHKQVFTSHAAYQQPSLYFPSPVTVRNTDPYMLEVQWNACRTDVPATDSFSHLQGYANVDAVMSALQLLSNDAFLRSEQEKKDSPFYMAQAGVWKRGQNEVLLIKSRDQDNGGTYLDLRFEKMAPAEREAFFVHLMGMAPDAMLAIEKDFKRHMDLPKPRQLPDDESGQRKGQSP